MPKAPREAVSVVVPFAGDPDDARATLLALSRLAFGAGDEAIVVDNSAQGVLARLEHPDSIRIVRAREQASSFYARNVGAGQAKNGWILFLDSDCLPPASLIDDYFADPVAHNVGAVAGAVLPPDDVLGLVARYKRFRRHLDQKKSTQAEKPWAATANLLVRRNAWADLGGFAEGIRSGGDIDFCWRLAAAGWRLSYEPRVVTRHLHRDTLKAHASQQIRYGGAHTWLRRRYPEARMSRPLRIQLPLSAAGALRRAAVGEWEWSVFHLLDGLTAVLLFVGKLRGNRVAIPDGEADIALVADSWPLAENGVRPSLDAREESRLQLEARRRPVRIARDRTHGLPSHYMEDDSPLDVAEGLAWLLTHRPKEAARYILGARGVVRGATGLARLAPAARRVARSGARRVHGLDAPSADDARALAELAGATYDE
jgi:GT2 family glycosyltransferase